MIFIAVLFDFTTAQEGESSAARYEGKRRKNVPSTVTNRCTPTKTNDTVVKTDRKSGDTSEIATLFFS